MADLTVFPIPQIPNGYNKLGKKLMIHDLTEPEATSTKLINFENILSTSVTYAELVNLITNNLLIEGGFYLLTDFVTVYDQMDFDNTGSLKPTLITKTSTNVEEIWVLALSSNQIADRAYSKTYPNDEIQYDWTYNATLVNGSPAKGRISERIDENNNRTDYDHREIKFIRYDDGAGNFNVINDNGNSSQEFLTFVQNFTGGVVKDNWLGDFYSIGAFLGQEYANNVFSGTGVVSNRFGSFIWNNTLLSFVQNNIVNGYMYNNIVIGNMFSNIINGSISDNIFNYIFIGCNINGDLANNIINGDFEANYIYGYVTFNTFNSLVNSNDFYGYIDNNVFNFNILNNSFNYSIYNNTFGGVVEGNILNCLMNSNIFSEVFSYNNIRGDFNSNTFNGQVVSNTYNGQVTGNTFTFTGGYLYYLTIADGLVNKTIDDVTYPFLFGTSYEKKIFQASNSNVYARYFDGTNDVNTLIP